MKGRFIRDLMWRQHQEYWQSVPGQRHAKSFLSKLSDKRTAEFLKLKRSQAQVKGLLTGHCHLKGHLFKPGTSPICGTCHMVTETATHILCECVALAGLTFHCLGKHSMEASHHKIPLCKILYFVRGTGLLVE
jgi:hypothetical protein